MLPVTRIEIARSQPEFNSQLTFAVVENIDDDDVPEESIDDLAALFRRRKQEIDSGRLSFLEGKIPAIAVLSLCGLMLFSFFVASAAMSLKGKWAAFAALAVLTLIVAGITFFLILKRRSSLLRSNANFIDVVKSHVAQFDGNWIVTPSGLVYEMEDASTGVANPQWLIGLVPSQGDGVLLLDGQAQYSVTLRSIIDKDTIKAVCQDMNSVLQLTQSRVHSLFKTAVWSCCIHIPLVFVFAMLMISDHTSKIAVTGFVLGFAVFFISGTTLIVYVIYQVSEMRKQQQQQVDEIIQNVEMPGQSKMGFEWPNGIIIS